MTSTSEEAAAALVLPEVRKRSLRLLVNEIDDVLKPLDYVREKAGRGDVWIRRTLAAQTYVHIQKSMYGTACFINIGHEPGNYTGVMPSFRDGTSQRLSQLLDDVAEANRLDMLPYEALDGASPLRRDIVDLVRDRAVPYLAKFHSGPDRFLTRLLKPLIEGKRG
ncbi:MULTISPECIES: hypothetical protein [Asticcacaulis]|uniref:hypothetical protein n=1 Tax=Asticcacaulis TaxID=76890 RepID=UPI001AE8747F|nr:MULTISPECIES: hypothetical protein [Asticcacaulis]MBP2159992.1 hypothetical protein [Asticcacaulis solisilvae]MDR6801037.1 hypothetical protein [Asticcacaulis sp. BE141]